MYLGVDGSINPTPTPTPCHRSCWNLVWGSQLHRRWTMMNSSGIRLHLLNIHTRRQHVNTAKFLVMLLKFQSDRGWVFGRCFSQGAVPRAGPCKMSGMTKLWIDDAYAFHFLQISWESIKHMEGYRRICEAINQEHQQMLHCKKQRQRFSMKECQRISECEIPSSLVFLSFFHPECGTHRTAPDRNEKSLAPRKVEDRHEALQMSFPSSRRRGRGAPAPVVSPSEGLRPQKMRWVFRRFSCEQILLNLLQYKKIYKLKVFVPKIYRMTIITIN